MIEVRGVVWYELPFVTEVDMTEEEWHDLPYEEKEELIDEQVMMEDFVDSFISDFQVKKIEETVKR